VPWLTTVEFDSFWNVWFWTIMVVAWSMTCHWTVGVPYDAIQMADRKGGEWADHCEALAQANVHRMCYYSDKFGVYLAAILGFILAGLGTLGFHIGFEFAQALFLLFTPLALVQVLGIGLAHKIRRDGLEGEKLRRALSRRRWWNQIIGIASVMVIAAYAVLFAIERETFIY
jgi:hypothetical protein